MTSYDPQELKDAVLEEYGIDVSLDECIAYLETDPCMTPESVFLLVQDQEANENVPLIEGELVKIPKGFKEVDFERLNVPESSGNYIWLLKDGCNLPQPKDMPNPVFNRIKIEGKEFRVFYTGKGENLKKRIRTHLNGPIKSSTLRYSIAALMELPFDYYKRKPKLSTIDEEKVSTWLRTNCVVMYMENKNCESVEKKLIVALDPPLNIESNPRCNNGNYIDGLKRLRSDKEKNDVSVEHNNKSIWVYCLIIIIALAFILMILS
jgi:predicted GIY-YIG superfamily endonuclease